MSVLTTPPATVIQNVRAAGPTQAAFRRVAM